MKRLADTEHEDDDIYESRRDDIEGRGDRMDTAIQAAPRTWLQKHRHHPIIYHDHCSVTLVFIQACVLSDTLFPLRAARRSSSGVPGIVVKREPLPSGYQEVVDAIKVLKKQKSTMLRKHELLEDRAAQ